MYRKYIVAMFFIFFLIIRLILRQVTHNNMSKYYLCLFFLQGDLIAVYKNHPLIKILHDIQNEM